MNKETAMSLRQGTLAMAFIVLSLLAGLVSSESAELLGYENGTLWDVSPVTGASNPRSTIGGLVDIEFGASGTLFGLSQDSYSTASSLFSINPVTGVATLIGPTGLGDILEGDLAFNPATGTLYGLYQLATPDLNVFTINMTTGAATIIGGFDAAIDEEGVQHRDPQGMAFDGAGNLFALTTNEPYNSLLEINPTTGEVISEILLEVIQELNQLGPAGMDFDPLTNTMYVTADCGCDIGIQLYTLNTTNGLFTTLLDGATLYCCHGNGLAVIPQAQAVPEPATLLLLAGGMTVAGLARRGRQLMKLAAPFGPRLMAFLLT